MESPHKSRKKKKGPGQSVKATEDTVISNEKGNIQTPAFPLVAYLWPARTLTSQWVLLPLTLMVVGLFRWTVGFWGYSGFNVPPMHGDFEAQRHWMEMTIHLPMSQWYFHDLEYWGLDYPPLTAYHSWVLGKIGSMINPAWFALRSSNGFEEQLLKVYMRATVLVSEYLVYIPAIIILNRKFSRLRGVNIWESSIALVAILLQPATILIDHGHFQYNTVMLGFVVASMSSILASRLLWGCVFFVAALCYKQMALYYAPAIFAYMLGVCMLSSLKFRRLSAIAIVTLVSFAVMFAPLLLGALYDSRSNKSPIPELNLASLPPLLSWALNFVNPKAWYHPPLLQLAQSIHRIFPFARGLFEDKVANLWCALNTVHKLNVYPTAMLQRVSLLATFIFILPGCMVISLFPRGELLPWAMASSAWGFFLCSFQVHEKSVLLPLLPMTILLGGDRGLGPEIRAWVGLANMLGTWTLFPLLKRDELRVPYFVISLLWAYILGLPPTSFSLYTSVSARPSPTTTTTNNLSIPSRIVHLAFYAAMGIWHLLDAFVQTPDGKPDLWVVVNVAIGAAGFGMCFVWCTWQLILRSGVMEDYFGVRMRLEGGKEKTL